MPYNHVPHNCPNCATPLDLAHVEIDRECSQCNFIVEAFYVTRAIDTLFADDYHTQAMRTSNGHKATRNERLTNAAFGFAGETGEIADHLKKAFFHGHGLDVDHLIDELGDLQWYIVQACDALDVPLSQVMQRNIDKLRKRYPTGFSSEASINRT